MIANAGEKAAEKLTPDVPFGQGSARKGTTAEMVHEYPELRTLLCGLNSIFRSSGRDKWGHVEVLSREPHPCSSTYPSEIVTCRLNDGAELRLLCKYSAGREGFAFGHRRGLGYEGWVYRHVVSPTGLPAMRFYGTYQDPETRWTWIVMQFLDSAWMAGKSNDGLRRTARWIARFHEINQRRLSEKAARSQLIVYDGQYYAGWLKRTDAFSQPLRNQYPWLAQVLERAQGPISLLLAQPPTIIHGEYTIENVISSGSDENVYPIDWESAAVGAGEIDLAMLLDGWDVATETWLVREYASARWPDGAPAQSEQVLNAARLYVQLRWLGDVARLTVSPGYGWRFKLLYSAATQLGLI